MDKIVVADSSAALSILLDRASRTLSEARTSAEILDARDQAAFAYDAAKRAARLAAAKGAHDNLIATAYRAQGHALEIEAKAKSRLADEYDAAQERGEVQTVGGDRKTIVPERNNDPPTVADLGITRKQIHDARRIRDAERERPGVVHDTLAGLAEKGEEPSRANLNRVIRDISANLKEKAAENMDSRLWSDEELEQARRLAESGKTASQIAKKISRSPEAIYRKCKALKISLVHEKPSKTHAILEQHTRRQMNAQMWASLRAALEGLTSLPQPADVLIAVRSFDRNLVPSKLEAAYAWLKEFRNVWHDYQESQSGTNRTDARDGIRAA